MRMLWERKGMPCLRLQKRRERMLITIEDATKEEKNKLIESLKKHIDYWNFENMIETETKTIIEL